MHIIYVTIIFEEQLMTKIYLAIYALNISGKTVSQIKIHTISSNH